MSSSLKSEEFHGQFQEQDPILPYLTSQGIAGEDLQKLEDKEILSYNDLMMHKKNFTGIKGLSEDKFKEICEAAEKLVKSTGIEGRSDAVISPQGIDAVEKLKDAGTESSGQHVAIVGELISPQGIDAVEKLKDAGTESSGHVAIGELISPQGIDAVEKLKDAGTESSGQHVAIVGELISPQGIDAVEKLKDAGTESSGQHVAIVGELISPQGIDAVEKLKDAGTESSGHVAIGELISPQGIDAADVEKLKDAGTESSGQHVAIGELISQGFDVGDVEMLRDAGIVTCNYLMYINKNLSKIVAAEKPKEDGEAAEKPVKTIGLSMDKFYEICEAAEKLVNQGLSGAKGDNISKADKKLMTVEGEILITLNYQNYKASISDAVKEADNNYSIWFSLNDEIVKPTQIKAIQSEIDKSNKEFKRDDQFSLKDFVKHEDKKGKNKEKIRDIILY